MTWYWSTKSIIEFFFLQVCFSFSPAFQQRIVPLHTESTRRDKKEENLSTNHRVEQRAVEQISFRSLVIISHCYDSLRLLLLLVEVISKVTERCDLYFQQLNGSRSGYPFSSIFRCNVYFSWHEIFISWPVFGDR